MSEKMQRLFPQEKRTVRIFSNVNAMEKVKCTTLTWIMN
jgi:hypothetical protein